jgi:hypothetical protein
METDDLLVEGYGDGCGGVGVAQRNEVRVLGEAVDHRHYDRLPAHLRETLDDVHGDVLPYRGGNVELLEEADGWRCSVLWRWQTEHLYLATGSCRVHACGDRARRVSLLGLRQSPSTARLLLHGPCRAIGPPGRS